MECPITNQHDTLLYSICYVFVLVKVDIDSLLFLKYHCVTCFSCDIRGNGLFVPCPRTQYFTGQ